MSTTIFKFVRDFVLLGAIFIGFGRLWLHRSWHDVITGIVVYAAILVSRDFLLPWMDRDRREATERINLRKQRETLRSLLTRRPFEPICVKTSNGQVFEIRQPNMASLAKSAILIVHPAPDGTPSDNVESVPYLNISSVDTMISEKAA